MSEPLLKLENLSFSYKLSGHNVQALKNLNLAIYPQDFVAIQGPSGSGKSTLLYVLGALLRPDSGRVVFDGTDLASCSDEDLAFIRNQKIGFIFQQFHLIPRMNILQNILLPTVYQPDSRRKTVRESDSRARQLLETLGLHEHIKHKPNQLSGGQQQRVAIARALMGNTKLILADEPTGNLDSTNSAQIMSLLKKLNSEGQTIVIITHDPEIAKQCRTAYIMRDGELKLAQKHDSPINIIPLPATADETRSMRWRRWLRSLKWQLPIALDNLRSNKIRSALTMIGIVIGIASVLAMLTLGQYAKRSVLKSYESMGVNRLTVWGHRNWRRKAVDNVGVTFDAFSWEKDLLPLRTIFPHIQWLSPWMDAHLENVNSGGKTKTEDLSLVGINTEYTEIANRRVIFGRKLSVFDIQNRSQVCIVGYDIARELFTASPIGEVLTLKGSPTQPFSCRIIGVYAQQKTNNDRAKPDTEVHVPYTLMPFVANRWDGKMHEFTTTIARGGDIERTAKGIENFFQKKYGKSANFRADPSAILVENLKKFVNVFAVLLAGIAMLALLVGGMGITNMMLISVVERYKEIGLRKALGATNHNLRTQFLLESVVICIVAGLIGLGIGFSFYETILYVGQKIFPKAVTFEWTLEPLPLLLSFTAIVFVGILSGLFPAVKAERLSVIEALRSE